MKQLLAFSAFLMMTSSAFGNPLFVDTFNRASLAHPNWATLGNGHIVSDPLSSGHGGVLAFDALAFGGDLFSVALAVPIGTLQLSFDYLSLGVQNSTGGAIGVDNPGEHWLSYDPGPGPLNGIATGQWHHIDVSFLNGSSSLKMKLEQWDGGNSDPNTAFFDNIVLDVAEFSANVPEPSTVGLFVLGGAAIFARRRQA